MPSFSDATKRKRVYLPSTAAASEADKRWVDLDLNITIGSILDTIDVVSDKEKTLQMLTRVIVGWNNTLDDGTPIPVSDDSIKQIGLADFTFLAEQIAAAVSPDGGDPDGHLNKSPEAADAAPDRLG